MHKKIWRHYEHILDIDWIYSGGGLLNMSSQLHQFGIKNYIKETLGTACYFDGHFYFHPDEYRATQKDILQRVLRRPDWGILFNCRLKKLIDKYFTIARQINQKNLRLLSNKELSDLWKELYQAKEDSHAAGGITTWIIDADEQPFSKYLINKISQLVKKVKCRDNPAKVFSILTTPTKNSYIQQEEIDLLRLLKKVKKIGIVKLRPKIKAFAQKYGWIYYKYLGPAKNPQEYENILKDWLKQNLNAEIKLREIAERIKESKKSQKYLMDVLRPDTNFKKLISFAQGIVFLKDYRKMSQFYGAYVNEKVLNEIASRLSLLLRQIRQFLPWEIEPALLENKFDPNILNQRYKFSVFYSRFSNFRVLTGEKAHSFLKSQKFEKIEKNIKELKGLCACLGKVKGNVKIINHQKEIGKIKVREIMISHATYPALVPAMKKAAAIVTDEGGLTCHAAIVSRELGIPCIIGTKIATKVLKDGDLVEVDAEKGTVRIIKKAK